jgi:hypothetical protein
LLAIFVTDQSRKVVGNDRIGNGGLSTAGGGQMNESRSIAEVGLPAHGPTHVHEREPSGWAYVGRFVRHLAEMILAMLVGMAVWGAILSLVLNPIGLGGEVRTYPEVRYGLMAVFMSVPMVLLMRYRKHSWGRGMEMVLGMVAPMAAVVLCWRLGVGAYIPWFADQGLGTSTHVAMYLGMVLLMLYRRKEYVHPHTSAPVAGAQASA